MDKKKANTKELMRHAFDIMTLMQNKSITIEEAKAHANLIKQANNLLRYELDRAIAERKFENITIREIEEI